MSSDMSSDRRHPDLFTAEEAAAYLRLASERSLETLREQWGLRPLPIGRGLYHRRDLDQVVERALTGQQSIKGMAGGQGTRTRLKIGG